MDRQDGFFPHHRTSCAKSFLPDCVIEILRHVKKWKESMKPETIPMSMAIRALKAALLETERVSVAI